MAGEEAESAQAITPVCTCAGRRAAPVPQGLSSSEGIGLGVFMQLCNLIAREDSDCQDVRSEI